jgi:hypothetical protein
VFAETANRTGTRKFLSSSAHCHLAKRFRVSTRTLLVNFLKLRSCGKQNK